MRLIDADVPAKEIRHLKERASTFGHPDYRLGYISALSCVEGMIASAATIDAEPVRHGRWDCEGSGYFFCNECKRYFVCVGGDGELNYCPNCGTKMDLEVEHD